MRNVSCFAGIAALVLGAACVYAGEWDIEIPDGTGDAGWCISLALDENDKPHISYDYGFAGGDNLMYAYKEGSSWYTEVVDDSVEYSMCTTSIGVDSNNRPRIAAHPLDSDLGLRFAERSGSQWNTVTLDEGVIVQTLALGVDSGDRPHIMYDDNEKYDLKYAYYDGSSWHIATVDTTPQWIIRHVDMAIDAVDHLHVIYIHDRKLKYAYYDGASWRFDVIEDDLSFTRPSIAVGVNNEPHVIYYDDETDYIKYAYYDSLQWNVENVIKLDPVGTPDPTIAVDAEGEAHIAYSKRNAITDHDLVYGHRKSSTWEFTVVDDEGSLGLFVDIALDSFEFPHIAYHRCTDVTGQLKYAWYYDDDIGISLDYFCAEAERDGILLRWATKREYDHAGFNLYRAASASRSAKEKLNVEVIGGSSPYRYADADVVAGEEYEYWLGAVDLNGDEGVYGPVKCVAGGTRKFTFNLARNAPNPARTITKFSFTVPTACEAKISFFDITGRKVMIPFAALVPEGETELEVDVSFLAPGVYTYRLEAGGASAARRMVVIR